MEGIIIQSDPRAEWLGTVEPQAVIKTLVGILTKIQSSDQIEEVR